MTPLVESDWKEYTLLLFPSDYIMIGAQQIQITPEEYPHGAYAVIKIFPIAAREREVSPAAREREAS